MTEFDWGKVAQDLAKGLIGKLPFPLNIIGGDLLAGLLPSPPSMDWEQVLEDFQVFVKQALAEQAVIDATDDMNGVISFMSTFPDLAKTGTKSSLSDDLKPYNVAMNVGIISKFQSEDNQVGTLANFMIGAGVNLGILQELALQDPDSAPSDPESGTVSVVRTTASNYGNYVRKAGPGVIQARMDLISDITTTVIEPGSPGVPGLTPPTDPEYEFSWIDTSSGANSAVKEYQPWGGHGVVPALFEQQYETHRVNAMIEVAALVQSNFYDVASNWQLLMSNPLPNYTTPSPAPPPVVNLPLQQGVWAAGSTTHEILLEGENFQDGLTVSVAFVGGDVMLSGSAIEFASSSAINILAVLGNPGGYSLRVNNPDGGVSNIVGIVATR